MIAKDDYSTTSYLNEGSVVNDSVLSTYITDSPLGNVKVYDLDAEIAPIERVQIVPNVPNLAPAIPSNTPAIQATTDTSVISSTIAPISPENKQNYLLYGGGALVLALVAYKVLKKK